MDDEPPEDDDAPSFLRWADLLWFGFVQAVVWVMLGLGAVAGADALGTCGLGVWCGTFALGLVWVVRYPWRRRTSLPWLLMCGPLLGCLVSGFAGGAFRGLGRIPLPW